MPQKDRILQEPAVLFAAIERVTHDSLRRLAFKTSRSIADLTREALDDFLERHPVSTPRKAKTPPKR